MFHWCTSPQFLIHVNFCSELSTFHKETNIIPLLIVLLAMEKLPIFKTCSFPDFFCQPVTLNFVLLWAIYLTSFGLLMVEKYFDIINFFKRSNFPSAPLPCLLRGQAGSGRGLGCVTWCQAARAPKAPGQHPASRWAVVLLLGCQTVVAELCTISVILIFKPWS